MAKQVSRSQRVGALGKHLLLDLYECNVEKLKEAWVVSDLMLKAALAAKATIIGHEFHNFSPFGVSGVVVIAESHLTIHTWPERAYAAIDIFTCGDIIIPNMAANLLIQAFESQKSEIKDFTRGHFPLNKEGKLPHKIF